MRGGVGLSAGDSWPSHVAVAVSPGPSRAVPAMPGPARADGGYFMACGAYVQHFSHDITTFGQPVRTHGYGLISYAAAAAAAGVNKTIQHEFEKNTRVCPGFSLERVHKRCIYLI